MARINISDSLLEVLYKKYERYLREWDHHDYKIQAPISLDDAAVVQITLINASGFKTEIYLPVGRRLADGD